MIDDGVEHQAEVRLHGRDILPLAERRVDLAIVAHRESVIGGPRVEGQDVHAADDIADVLVAEDVQGLERLFVRRLDLVAVGDEDGIAFAQRRFLRRDVGTVRFEQRFHPPKQGRRRFVAV